MKLLKNILIIVVALPICIFFYKIFQFGTFGNIILFMSIYILVSIIFEVIFGKLIKNKQKK